MKLQSITKRLRNGSLFSYSLGRFLTVRRLHSTFMGLRDGWANGNSNGAESGGTIFPGVSVDSAVGDMERDAVAFGLDLPEHTVQEIRRYAVEHPCHGTGGVGDIHYGEVEQGRLPDGQKVAMAFVHEPLQCAAVERIYNDPTLWSVCRRYLGYTPRGTETRLYWSFAGEDLSEEDRRSRSQTIDYHVDVHNFNFCYAHFYITDVDAGSGAHVLIRGSHRHKRLRWLLGSAAREEEELLGYYSPEDILTIEGKAGTGFVEDTSCYHRALPPTERDRLLLQIRFF